MKNNIIISILTAQIVSPAVKGNVSWKKKAIFLHLFWNFYFVCCPLVTKQDLYVLTVFVKGLCTVLCQRIINVTKQEGQWL